MRLGSALCIVGGPGNVARFGLMCSGRAWE